MPIKYILEELKPHHYKVSAEDVESLYTPEIKMILDLIQSYGFEVRIVGGAVRDLLLGKTPRDVDLATDALPDQVIYILSKHDIDVDASAIIHGTVKAVIDEEKYEITTLNFIMEQDVEGKPFVNHTNSWEDDAFRRDFSMNALSMDLDGNVYDYLSGLKDIEEEIVRGIPNFETKILRDPKVILRTFKLLAKLKNPKITKSTLDTIQEHAPLVKETNPSIVEKLMAEIALAPNAEFVLRLMNDWGVHQYLPEPTSDE